MDGSLKEKPCASPVIKSINHKRKRRINKYHFPHKNGLFLLFFLAACAGPRINRARKSFFTYLNPVVPNNAYDPKKERQLLVKIAEKDYQDLTILIVNNPKPIKPDFDINDCTDSLAGKDLKDEVAQQLESMRRHRCQSALEFLQSKSDIKLVYAKFKFNREANQEDVSEIRRQNVIGVLFIEKFDKAIESMTFKGRHDVFQYLRVKFVSLLKGLETNWDKIDIEQWARPDPQKKLQGLSQYSFQREQAMHADHTSLAGYQFSPGYRTNILDHLDKLTFLLEKRKVSKRKP